MVNYVDLNEFTLDDGFYGDLNLVLTVKNFDLQSIRNRYLKSKEQNSGRVGSVERREVGNGGLVYVEIRAGKITHQEILKKLKEPRAIAANEKFLAVGAEDVVYLISEDGIQKVENQWFSYIHTLDFSPDGKLLLVSSSGFDCFFEYDLETLQPVNEWFAWENGIDQGYDSQTDSFFHLTRDENQFKKLKSEGKKVKLINDPLNQVLPTAQRAAFINSTVYDKLDSRKIYMTLFHKGEVLKWDKSSSTLEKSISEMKSPHGGGSGLQGEFATNTLGGEFVQKKDTDETRFQFRNLPEKPEILTGREWLQNSVYISESVVLTIDSNRTSFVVYDLFERKISMIPYDENWAVQDVVNWEFDNELLSKIELI